jgi:predicted metalloprotease with PDZ domain
VDTAASAQIVYATPFPDWSNYRRPASYDNEGMLIWLEADALIRERTQGRRSLDDFCRDFFGGPERAPALRPYTREDVEATLARILPFDWHGFFEARVEAVAPAPPLAGLAGAGLLVYTAAPNAFALARAGFHKSLDYTTSLGLVLDPAGKVKDVAVDSPAWQGGVDPGMQVLAVDGQRFSPRVLEEAVAAAQGRAAPLELVVEQGPDVRTVRVDYHGGVLFPHLERDPARPDLLSAILTRLVPPPR